MKINIIANKIILVMMLIFISTTSVCFADMQHVQQDVLDGGGTATGGDSGGTTSSSNYLPNLNDNGYKPVPEDSGNVKTIISKILGALTIVGIIIAVIAIAIIGYNTIIGSASDKAFEKEKMIGLAIGASILIGSSQLAKMLMSIAESL